RVPRSRAWLLQPMAALIVGMPGLRLEGEEDADPLIGRGEVQDEAAVLPDAIVLLELPDIALVHVDVVNAVAGLEAEGLVGLAWFRPPTVAVGENARVRLVAGTIDEVREAVAEIVVRSQQIRRQGPHVQAIEEIATDEVERQAAGLLCDRRDTFRKRDQSVGYDMTEVLRDEEQQFRRAGLRLDVDGDA